MIQPLRAAHRRTFAALAVALPAIFVAGLLVRHPETPAQSTQGSAAPAAGKKAFESDHLFRHRIQTMIFADAAGRAVELRPVEDLQAPDLLLYWSASGDDVAHATLLGAFEPGRRYRLPASGGRLLLYSLAHRELVDAAALEAMP